VPSAFITYISSYPEAEEVYAMRPVLGV